MIKTIAIIVTLGALFAIWVGYPLANYNYGTSVDVSGTVLQQPFIDGDELVYRWSGNIVRSCDVTLQRRIIDSDQVVTRLTSRNLVALPASSLGPAQFDIRVTVPVQIAEGEAVYEVVEIPRCNWMQRMVPVAVPYPPITFTVTRPDE